MRVCTRVHARVGAHTQACRRTHIDTFTPVTALQRYIQCNIVYFQLLMLLQGILGKRYKMLRRYKKPLKIGILLIFMRLGE